MGEGMFREERMSPPSSIDRATPLRHRREAILNIYSLVLCALLFVSPWLFGFAREVARVEAWVIAIAIIAISIAALVWFAEWEEWTILALGLWLLASPWALGFAHSPAMRIDVAIGALVVYVTALLLWVIHYMPSPDGKEP
jgi:uncharacterized membrane protein required for colicin V production